MRPFDPEQHYRHQDGKFAPMNRTEPSVNIGGEMSTLVSSWMQGAAYDETTGAATFCLNGRYYTYDVPEDVYRRVVTAESPGAAYNQYIKGKAGSLYAEKCDSCGRWILPSRGHNCRPNMHQWMRDTWMAANAAGLVSKTDTCLSGAPRNWTARAEFIQDIENHASDSGDYATIQDVDYDTAVKLLGKLPVEALSQREGRVTTGAMLEAVVQSEGDITINGRLYPPSHDNEGIVFDTMTVSLETRRASDVLRYLQSIGLKVADDDGWLAPIVTPAGQGKWTVDFS